MSLALAIVLATMPAGVNVTPSEGLLEGLTSSMPAPVSGTATWYCLAGRSACHRDYPQGMYAAAGPALRKALGPDWRGTTVRVRSGDRSVAVTLVDWCRCGGDRVIDLYSQPFSRLAPLSRGVIPVEVSRLVLPPTDTERVTRWRVM